MKFKAFLFASITVFLILPNLSFAKVQWYRTYNGPSNSIDWGNQIQADDSGYSYITGGSEGDFLTIKYDANGNVLWSSRFGNANETDFALGLAVDCLGNVYVSGIIDHFNLALFALVKYDPNGNLLWYQISNPGLGMNTDMFMTIQPGRIYMALTVDGTNGGTDILVLAFDENGSQLWSHRYDPTFSTYEYSIAIGSDRRHVYIAGKFPASTGGGYDFGLIRLDRNGNLHYIARHNVHDDYPAAMKVLAGAEVVMTGFSYKSGGSEIVTMKFDSVGVLQWADSYIPPGSTSGKGWAISTDLNGNLFIAGESFNGTNNDFTTLKYSRTGQLLWDQTYDFGYDDAAGLIASDACGNVHVAGPSNGDVDKLIIDTNGTVLSKEIFGTPGNQDDYLYLMDMNRFGNLFVGGITDPGQQLYDYLLIKFDAQFCAYGFPDC